jgi:hypothetical protein
VSGLAGWETLVNQKERSRRFRAVIKGFWVWFWVINSILLVLFTFTYSKKTRVESLSYLSQKSDMTGLVIVGGNLGNNYPPLFYLNKYYLPIYAIDENYNADSLASKFAVAAAFPNYVIFYGQDKLAGRLEKFENSFHLKLVLEKEISPSLIDDILFHLNPAGNKNQAGYIYREGE